MFYCFGLLISGVCNKFNGFIIQTSRFDPGFWIHLDQWQFSTTFIMNYFSIIILLLDHKDLCVPVGHCGVFPVQRKKKKAS